MALFTPSVKGQLANTATALLTVDKNETWIIQNITISNHTALTVEDIKFYIYPNGDTAASDTQFFTLGSMPPGATRQVPLKHNLNSEDILAAVAGTPTAVNFIVSYAQRTD